MLRCRPFKLIDATILIAAAALWMARMRPFWDQFHLAHMAARNGISWRDYIHLAHYGLSVSLWMLTAAYLGIRLIRPRPTGWELIRQPGMLLLGVMIGLMILLLVLSPFVPLGPGMNLPIALALALAWLAALYRQRSRAEPGWIEGMGRSVAVGWILTTAATAFR